MRKSLTTSAAAIALLFAAPAPAANLLIDISGKLAGATGVDVGGTLYDVAFVDSTCISIFDGCDSNSDFDFSTQAAADLAGQALLDQVFLGIYDDQPELTLGCSDEDFCSVFIPYELTALGDAHNSSTVANGDETLTDNVGTGGATRVVNFAAFSFSTYATFTPSGVPEPSTWLMMLLGFGGIGVMFRLNRSTSGLLTA
jgi:hypothetical protein